MLLLLLLLLLLPLLPAAVLLLHLHSSCCCRCHSFFCLLPGKAHKNAHCSFDMNRYSILSYL